jgi:methyl-accepting chemotaxis protein
MNIKNWKIGTRLGVGFTLMSVLLLMISVVSFVRLNATQAEIDLILKDRYPKVGMVGEVQNNLAAMARMSRNMLIAGATGDSKKEADGIAKARSAGQQTLDELKKLITDGKGLQLVNQMESAKAAYFKLLDEYLELIPQFRFDEADELLQTQLQPAEADYLNRLDALANFQGELMNQAGENVEGTVSAAKTMIVVISAIATVLGVLINILTTRSIVTPVRQAVQVAQTVAAGDLTSRIEAESRDEMGQLLDSLKEMNDGLVKIVGQVRTGTQAIATASGQIAAGNQDLSSRTEEQASSLEETASSMEELTSTVKRNADNARQANQLALAASHVAAKGGDVVAEVVNTMGSINESSKKIVDIISVIDGIAFQTNILALNAAVEAARAGEQGRGFAVVATEVRNLAQRSASAAKEIKELINASVEKVESGSKLVTEAGSTMEEVVSSVRRVTDIMAEITAASQEQSAGIEQVNQAISQMDEVTQQNAALVEEAAAAAQSLQDQAAELASLVSTFRLEVNLHSAAPIRPQVSVVNVTAPGNPVSGLAARKRSGNLIEASRAPDAKRLSASKDSEWDEF